MALTTKLYVNCRVCGPYLCKTTNRYVVEIYRNDLRTRDSNARVIRMSLARFLMQEHLERLLDSTEQVDHEDENKTNDVIGNLQVLSHQENSAKSKQKHATLNKHECLQCGSIFTMDSKQHSSWLSRCRRGGEGPFCNRRCSMRFSHQNKRL